MGKNKQGAIGVIAYLIFCGFLVALALYEPPPEGVRYSVLEVERDVERLIDCCDADACPGKQRALGSVWKIESFKDGVPYDVRESWHLMEELERCHEDDPVYDGR